MWHGSYWCKYTKKGFKYSNSWFKYREKHRSFWYSRNIRGLLPTGHEPIISSVSTQREKERLPWDSMCPWWLHLELLPTPDRHPLASCLFARWMVARSPVRKSVMTSCSKLMSSLTVSTFFADFEVIIITCLPSPHSHLWWIRKVLCGKNDGRRRRIPVWSDGCKWMCNRSKHLRQLGVWSTSEDAHGTVQCL